MRAIKALLTCGLLAALIALVVALILLVRTASTVVSSLPAGIERSIREQGEQTRGAALAAITETRKDLLARVDRLANVSETSINAVTERADAQLGVLNSTVAVNLKRANDSIAEVAAVRRDIAPILENAGQITRQANEALPLFLDCDHNQDCVFNRYVGTSRGIERAAMSVGLMSADVREALPVAIDTWAGIGTNVQGITGNVDRLTKPRWYDRLLGYGLNGVLLYRNLNPVTNLTVKGAQIISARP